MVGPRWASIHTALDAASALILTALVVAPLRSLFFLDETEPFRRRSRRRR